MNRDRRTVAGQLLAVAAVLLASGCGSSASAPASAVGAAPSASAAAQSEPGTAPSEAPSAAAAGGAEQFCSVVKQQVSALQGTQLSSLLAGGTPAAWKAYLASATAVNQQLVDAAPADIRPSVVTLQESTRTLATTMAAAGYDPAKVGSAKLVKAMRSKDSAAAGAALTTYVKGHFAIDLTKPGG